MYTPNNQNIFDAAYTGAFNALVDVNKVQKSLSTSTYSGLAIIAGAWAQAYDIAYALTTADQLQVMTAYQSSFAFMQNRGPTPSNSANLLSSTWAPYVNAIIVQANVSESYYTSQGLTANPWNSIGPRGPDGPTGSTGPTGATGPGGYLESTMGTLDFTVQTTQTLYPDGPYTINGLTFNKLVSNGDSTAMKLTNGTGIVMIPKQTTSYGSTTAPYIRLLFSRVIPNFELDTPLRIWSYWSAQNPSGNYDEAFQGVESSFGGDIGNVVWRAGIAYSAIKEQQLALAINNGSYNFQTTNSGPTDLVEVLTLPDGINGLTGSLSSSANAYASNAWPDVSTIIQRVHVNNATANIGYASGSTASQFGATWGAMRQGSSTVFSCTLAAIRIQYR